MSNNSLSVKTLKNLCLVAL